jgi:hypothetical protein
MGNYSRPAMGTGLHPLNLTMKPQINPTSSEEAFTKSNTAQAQPNRSNRPRPKLISPEPAGLGILGLGSTTTSRGQDAEHEGPELPVGALIDDIRSPLSSSDLSINDHVPASSSASSIIGSLSCSSDNESASTITTNSSFVSGESAANKSKAPKITTSNELNWCDRNELMANTGLFDGWKQEHF